MLAKNCDEHEWIEPAVPALPPMMSQSFLSPVSGSNLPFFEDQQPVGCESRDAGKAMSSSSSGSLPLLLLIKLPCEQAAPS